MKDIMWTLIIVLCVGNIIWHIDGVETINIPNSKNPSSQIVLNYNLDKISYNKTRLKKVRITNYTPRMEETDSTPYTNACNTIVAEGQIAVSRDIIKRYNLKCFDFIYIEELGKSFQYADKLNERKTNQIDIYKNDLDEAKKFGIKEMSVDIYQLPRNQ